MFGQKCSATLSAAALANGKATRAKADVFLKSSGGKVGGSVNVRITLTKSIDSRACTAARRNYEVLIYSRGG